MIRRQWELHDFGRKGLRLAQALQPDPGPAEIIVAVKAVALNYRDLLIMRDGMGMRIPMPFVPASDMSGEVVATGSKVTRFRQGDMVISSFCAGWFDGERPAEAVNLGGPGPGVMATHVALDQQWAVHRPRSMSHVEASTLPCAALTAWTALVELGRLRAGQTVLVHGTGGVALFGLQWALMHGARVAVVTSSADKAERARALGASQVLLRNQGDWRADLRAWTGGRGVDQVLETIGGNNLADSVAALAPGGSVSVIGMLAGAELSLSFYPLVAGRATVRGIGVGHRRSLEEVVRAVDAAGLAPVIDAQYGFEELPLALDQLERGSFGKIVLSL